MKSRATTTPSTLGRLLLDAIARIEAERGATYTYRQWEQDIEDRTGERIIYAHLRNLVAGRVKRQFRGAEGAIEYRPRQETLALALVPLRGYIDEDAAYLAAGYAPPRLHDDVAQLARLQAAAGDLTTAEAAGPELAALEQDFRDLLRRTEIALHRLTAARRAPPTE